jgi:hypothetical protein
MLESIITFNIYLVLLIFLQHADGKYFYNIRRGGLYFVTTSGHEISPIMIIEILCRFVCFKIGQYTYCLLNTIKYLK